MNWFKNNWMALLALIISALAFAWPIGANFIAESKQPSLVITMPTGDEPIKGAAHDVGGTSEHMGNLPADTDLWLVVKGDKSWYPSTKIQVGLNGSWTVPADLVRIGPREKVSDQQFDLVVYGVDSVNSALFSKAAESAARGGDGGMPIFPSGQKEFSKVLLTRTD